MDNLFSREWDVPAHAYVPPLAVAALNTWLWLTFSNDTGGMPLWALSWPAIRSEHLLLLVSHMFAHGGITHLAVNTIALLLVSPPLISRLGSPLIAWFRYTYIYIGSGVCGGLLFLYFNTLNSATVLGASGAIFGVLAALARVHPKTGAAVAVRSRRTWLLVKVFLQNHVALLLILGLIALFADNVGGLAWEAHLGGLVFGFFAAPLYLPRDSSHEHAEGEIEHR